MGLVERGKVKLTDPIITSAEASEIGGSQVYLKEGEVFPIEDENNEGLLACRWRPSSGQGLVRGVREGRAPCL